MKKKIKLYVFGNSEGTRRWVTTNKFLNPIKEKIIGFTNINIISNRNDICNILDHNTVTCLNHWETIRKIDFKSYLDLSTLLKINNKKLNKKTGELS